VNERFRPVAFGQDELLHDLSASVSPRLGQRSAEELVSGAAALSNTESAEIDGGRRPEMLAADAGRGQLVCALVGKGDRRRDIATEDMVDLGVGDRARETGLARGRPRA